jgi:hypothetical protein
VKLPALTTSITCSRTNDGPGALAHGQASVLLFARSHGLTYLHQPMRVVGHNYDGTPGWDDMCDRFFAVGLGEVPLSEVELDPSKIVRVQDPTGIDLAPDTTYDVTYCHLFSTPYPDRYDLIRRSLREKFCRANDLPVNVPRTKKLTIAVHVRRGDITPSVKERYTPTADIARHLAWTLDAVKSAGLEHRTCVFSQETPSELSPLQDLGAELYLHGPFRDAYTAMVQADILLTAKSSFSYLAGLMSRGIVLHGPGHRKPPSDWILLTGDVLSRHPDLTMTPRLLQT